MDASGSVLAARWRARSGGAATIDDPTPGALAARLTSGREMQAPHLDLIGDVFVDIEAGRCDRVMILAPPRHGKSRRAARWSPLWWLARNPDRRLVLASYASSLAEEHGRWIRDQIAGDVIPGLRLRGGSRAADHLDLAAHDGGMVAVGVGGGLTGKGADMLIIDDPVKDREEADSETMRRKTWEWYTDVALTRLHPGAAIVLIMTRWHEDDLGGRVFAQAGNRWRVIRLPALAEADDPLGRELDAPLWPERYDAAALAQIRAEVGGRTWNALYQQRPAAPDGAVFRRGWLRYLRPSLFGPLGMCAVFVDPATTANADSDDTGIVVGAKGTGEHADDVLVLADRTVHATPAAWGEAACVAAVQFGAQALVVEDNQGGQMCSFVLRSAWTRLEAQVRTQGRSMPAIVRVRSRDGKRTRAEPVAALYEAGRVLHAAEFADLEGQMLGWAGGGDSPDRLDAVVGVVSWLLRLGKRAGATGRIVDRRLAAR